MYPKYPVSGTIRALLKGPLGGPGWVWGLGAQGSGIHSRTCLAKLLLLKLYRVSGLWPHGSGLAESLVLVLLPLRVACPTSNWKSSLTSRCYAQGGGPLLSSASMVYFYIYISLSLSLPCLRPLNHCSSEALCRHEGDCKLRPPCPLQLAPGLPLPGPPGLPARRKSGTPNMEPTPC